MVSLSQLVRVYPIIIYTVVAVIGCVGVFTGVPAALMDRRRADLPDYANQYAKPFNEVTNVITADQTAYTSARMLHVCAGVPYARAGDHASDAAELAAPQVEVL